MLPLHAEVWIKQDDLHISVCVHWWYCKLAIIGPLLNYFECKVAWRLLLEFSNSPDHTLLVEFSNSPDHTLLVSHNVMRKINNCDDFHGFPDEQQLQ